jgi:two-component system, sensor histidine kinase and response regulator
MTESKPYVLIAEDSKTQADILRYILEEDGYEVDVAENAEEALVSIASRTPDILLTDIIMPGMDGYELCKKIRGTQGIESLPVVLVTQLYDPEDVIRGISCGANNFIIKPFDKKGLLARIRRVLNSGKIDLTEGETEVIEYNDTRYPVHSHREDLLNILLSIYDTAVSKNVELEQATERLNILAESLEELVQERTSALQRTTETVEQLLMQKNELITKIGHDLKTPLTPLVALLPHVQKYEQDDELREILTVLVNDVQVLKGLVEQTMKLSLLNQESFSMVEADISIYRVITEVITGYTFSIRQLEITIEIDIPTQCTVHISPFHATTIFENLISNAIKYNVKGGRITFVSRREGDFWIVSITDTGIGLTLEEQGKVFEEFYKADPSRHDHSSHGLGLSIVHRIISLYGGTITVSSPGKEMGTTFVITLPIHRNGKDTRRIA